MDVFFLNCVQANDDLSLSEEQDVTELKEILMSVHLNLNSSDRWRWMADSTGLFLVKNCYKLLQQIGSAEDFSSTLLEAFNKRSSPNLFRLKNLFYSSIPNYNHSNPHLWLVLVPLKKIKTIPFFSVLFDLFCFFFSLRSETRRNQFHSSIEKPCLQEFFELFGEIFVWKVELWDGDDRLPLLCSK
jgi:hypothetical protein